MSNLEETDFHRDSPDSLQYIIIQGPAFRKRALERLTSVKKSDLLVRASDTDQNILQVAATFHGDVEVMTQLVTLCPELFTQEREGDYEGQNVLHILVSKENLQGAEAILKHPSLTEDNRQRLLKGQAVGTWFKRTVLMGQLPLSVAALTLNLEMVDLLLGQGAKLQEVNSDGDTLLHSLIRFAHLYRSKETEVAIMMREIHTRLQAPETAPSAQAEPRCIWLIENKQGYTALKLAADLVLPTIFQLIVELEGVYRHLDRRDGLFDSLLYDITEIDPAAQQQRQKKNRTRPQHNGVAPLIVDGEPFPAHLKPGCCPCTDTPCTSAMKEPDDGARYVSVLEILCQKGHVEKVFKMINYYVIKNIIKTKWQHYRWWFWLGAVLHLLLMILLTVHAVLKAGLIKKSAEAALSTSTTTTTTTVSPISLSTTISATRPVDAASPPLTMKNEEVFVEVMAVVGVLVSLLMVGVEVLRWVRGIWFHLWLTHGNGFFRLQVVILALALIVDSLWYWIAGPVNNFFLILALLVGWWLCTFFLRGWKKTAFFTVMLQKVLLGDMLRFSAVILLELVAFSVVMHITFLATPGEPPKEFQDLGMAFLTMFKLMLGLGDVEVLGEASHPWLSTLLFMVFVVLTYVLMLNALIAMMANTCFLVSQNKVCQWELQRLSVVLLLESMLWPRTCGLLDSVKPKTVARYDLQKTKVVQETRYFTKVASVQTSHKERGAAILKRNPMMRAQSSDNLNAILTSVGNATFSAATDRAMTSPGSVMTSARNASAMAHLDLLASFAHQQAWLSSLGRNNLESASSPENTGHYRSDEQTGETKKDQRGSSRKSGGKKRALENSKREEESYSYALMRQTLLKAARRMVRRLSTSRQTSKEVSDAGLEPQPDGKQSEAHNKVILSDRRSPTTEKVPRKTTVRTLEKGKFPVSRQLSKVQFEIPPPEVYTISKTPKNDTSAKA